MLKTMEELRVESKIITGTELYKLMIDKKGKFKSEFKELKSGGKFHFSPWWSGNMGDENFKVSLLVQGKQVLGFGIFFVFRKHSWKEDGIYFDTVSVHTDFKGRGFSKLIMREVVDFAKKEGFKIFSSSATEEGAERVSPSFRQYATEQEVVVENQ